MSRKRKRDEVTERAREEEEARLPSTWSRATRKSGSSAELRLVDEPSVDRLFKAIKKSHRTKKYPVWGEGVDEDEVPPLGAPWLDTHARLSYPDRDVVERAVDSFFTLYNKKEKAAAELAKRMRQEPDEDGFVTVVRGGGRTAPARPAEAEEAKRKMLERERKKKEELTDFYRFQRREQRKAHHQQQIKQFEEDRKKVDALRQKKGRFRPEA